MDPTDRVVERTPPSETPAETIARLTAEKAILVQEKAEQAKKIADLEAKLAATEASLDIAKSEATIDHLTGLPNLSTIELELSTQLALVQRGSGSLAVAMFDLDNFKTVNDTYGHAQGDQVLRGFADRVRSHKRETDTVGRHGGEEFLAVFPIPEGTSPDDVETHILSRYHHMLTDLNRTGNEAEFIPQTVSIGCVIVDQNVSSANLAEIIAAADSLLYKSKANGRNQSTVAVFKDAATISI